MDLRGAGGAVERPRAAARAFPARSRFHCCLLESCSEGLGGFEDTGLFIDGLVILVSEVFLGALDGLDT